MKAIFAILVPLAVLGKELPVEALPSSEPGKQGMSAEGLAKVDPLVEALIKDDKLAGANVLVLRRGKIVYQQSFGMRDREEGKPMETNSLFRIYSMTKALTSTAALMLCEEGKMSLDDPVEIHLPGFAEPRVWFAEGVGDPAKRSPTIRDLLRHTSGVANLRGTHPVSRMYREGWLLKRNRTLDRLVANAGKAPLLYEPGTKWVYGTSSDILAAVVASVSGKPFENVIKERLIAPLGMVDTGYSVPAEKADRLSKSYRTKGENLVAGANAAGNNALQDPTFKGGGSGLISTISDYSRFLQMIANGGEFQGKRYLREDTVDLMRTNQLPRRLPAIEFGNEVRHGTGFGLGFCVRFAHDDRWDKHAVIGEYGWGGAASTHYWISPKHELVVVTMEQTMPYNWNLEKALKPIIYNAVLK